MLTEAQILKPAGELGLLVDQARGARPSADENSDAESYHKNNQYNNRHKIFLSSVNQMGGTHERVQFGFAARQDEVRRGPVKYLEKYVEAQEFSKIHVVALTSCDTVPVSSRCALECGRIIFRASKYAAMRATTVHKPMMAKPN
jgi:hypothetical protein